MNIKIKIILIAIATLLNSAANAETLISNLLINGTNTLVDKGVRGLQYQNIGQSFTSPHLIILSDIQFYVYGLGNPGTATIEILKFEESGTWGNTLGSVENYEINETGWRTVQFDGITMLEGGRYGFKIIPNIGLSAGISDTNGNLYEGGLSWFASDYNIDGTFSEVSDLVFQVNGNISPTVIPEPSTYILIVGLISLYCAILHKRKTA